MNRVFFVFAILFSASFLFAAPTPASLQARFDKLAEQHTFGNAEVLQLRAMMEEEKESDTKIDCTFCPDAFTWYLTEQDLFDEATWLFDRNADYGIKNQDGTTLLQIACRDGHMEFAEILIERGAEVNLPDNEGRTAIHYAVMSGNSKLVKKLLDLGSDPNKLTKKKETPLHFAAKYSGLEEVQFLIEHGASIKAINWALVENLKEQRRRQDKLYYDSDEGHIAALKSALGLKTPESLQSSEENEEDEEDDEDDAEDTENGKRSDSSSGKNGEVVIDVDKIPFHLLPRDVNDAANTDGMTALHFAVQKGDTEVVRFLVEHGADIKAQDTDFSRSAIHFAAENGNLDCIKYLTEQGADLLDRDVFGATALHYAAKNNKLNVIKFLVSKKADYTARDNRGWTAMHYAALGGSMDVVKYLLAKGLNINELNKSGRTPLFFAREHRELRKYMISKGAN